MWSVLQQHGATGSAEDSNVDGGAFDVLNGGTKAPAFIKEIKWKTFEATPTAPATRFINVQWEISDFQNPAFKEALGEYVGRSTFQKLELFSTDQKKAARAANMLVRIAQICEFPVFQQEPDDQTLAQLVGHAMQSGKFYSIGIELWTQNGKSGNWVNEVNPLMPEFVAVKGTKEAPPEVPQQQAAGYGAAAGAQGGWGGQPGQSFGAPQGQQPPAQGGWGAPQGQPPAQQQSPQQPPATQQPPQQPQGAQSWDNDQAYQAPAQQPPAQQQQQQQQPPAQNPAAQAGWGAVENPQAAPANNGWPQQ